MAPGLEAIRAAFERHDVAYVVIGGEARARGWPEQTEDVDVTLERSKENLARLADALEELGAGSASTRSATPVGSGLRAASTGARSATRSG